MTSFPEPFELPSPDPWENANEADRAQADQRLQGAATDEAFAALLSDPDAVVRVAAARAVGGRLNSMDDSTRAALVNALESETLDAVWNPLMAALLTDTAEANTAALKGLKAIGVLDPSERKRSAALEHLIDPPGGAPAWVSEFVRERLFSDESNYVRAMAATRAVASSADARLQTYATQWLKHAGIVPPALGADHPWHTAQKDDDYFAGERRDLLADDRGVRTTRSRAESAATGDASQSTRRAGPTLVQGHHNEASAAIKAQRVFAAVMAVVGVALVALSAERSLLGFALVGLAFAWAIGLQVWKWYRYG